MLASSIAAGVAKVLAAQLLEHVGVPSAARSVVQVPIDQLLSRAERKSAAVSLRRVGESVAEELLIIPRSLQDNPGAAQAAAATFLEVLEAANLSATRLVELNLDPQLVRGHILAIAGPHVKGASAERRGHVERAISRFCEALMAEAPTLPGVQLAFMQAVLRSRRNDA